MSPYIFDIFEQNRPKMPKNAVKMHKKARQSRISQFPLSAPEDNTKPNGFFFYALFRDFSTFSYYLKNVVAKMSPYFCNKKRLDVAATTVKPRSEITIE